MNRMGWVRHAAGVAFGALLLQCAPAFADAASTTSAPPPTPAGAARWQGHRFDWVQHTQHTLNELKAKLNLTPAQSAAWDTWSGGVMRDAHQQYEQRKPWMEEKRAEAMPSTEVTTPERMARGIEQLRARTAWMQEHLAQLEAAQVRTKDFYDALDKNQKTIFDLFWHEMHHRSAGDDEGWGGCNHEGYGPGPMREQMGPGCQY